MPAQPAHPWTRAREQDRTPQLGVVPGGACGFLRVPAQRLVRLLAQFGQLAEQEGAGLDVFRLGLFERTFDARERLLVDLGRGIGQACREIAVILLACLRGLSRPARGR